MSTKSKIIVKYSIYGGMFGYFILHPVVMIIGHIMLEPMMSHHQHTLWDMIISHTLMSFSFDMLPWSFAFIVTGALLGASYGMMQYTQITLKHLSENDGLTGIANRRYFDHTYKNLWAEALRRREPISLIMIDIDYFKNFNDTYGHQSGDDALKTIAATIKKHLKRPLDIVARYGGEEFVLVLPNTSTSTASLLAAKIRQEIESLAIPNNASLANSVLTISLGLASTVPTLETTPESLIHTADHALYQAKTNGRNRMEIDTKL